MTLTKPFNTAACKGTDFFHMNISSLTYNFDQLHALLSEISINFDIIGITESRLKKYRTRIIFSNMIEDSFISGNLATAISDHYGQFLPMNKLNDKKNIANTKVYHQDFQKINERRSENDLQNTN